MALQPVVQTLPIFGGIDTKTAPQFVDNQHTLVSQNTRFPAIAQATKRYGQTPYPTTILGGGKIATGTSIAAFQNELLQFDGRMLYSYSPSLQAWATKANLAEIDLTEFPVAGGGNSSCFNPSSVVLANIGMYAWDDGTNIHYTIQDRISGTYFVGDTILTPGIQPKVLAANGYIFIFWANTTILQGCALPINNPSAGFTSIVNVANFYPSMGFGLNVNAQDPASLLLVYQLGNFSVSAFIVLQAIPSLGVTSEVLNAVTITSPWVNVISRQGGGINGMIGYTANQFVTDQNVSKGVTPSHVLSGGATLTNFPSTIVYDSTANLYRWVTSYQWFKSGTPNQVIIAIDTHSFPTPTSMSSNPALTGSSQGQYLASTAVMQNGKLLCCTYSPVTYLQTNTPSYQATYYLCSDVNLTPIFRFFDSKAYTTGSTLAPLTLGVSLNSYNLTLPYVVALNTNTTTGDIYALPGIAGFSISFPSISRATIVPFGTTAVISCGNTYSYDGASVVESSYWQFPGGIYAAQSNTGGNLGVNPSGSESSVYTYQFTYEWTDIAGNFHISAPSFPTTITFAPGVTTGSVVFTIPALFLTLRKGVQIGIYRTVANAGVPLYREGTILNDPTTGYMTFTSTLSDLSIQSLLPLYTDGGLGELENDAAPSFSLLVATKNRVFGVPQDSPYQLWYSKPVVPGQPVRWNPAFTVNIETAGGAVTALSYIDTNAVLFKKERIYYLAGDGPDVTGNPSNGFSPLQLISTVTGCSQPRSTLPTSQGLYFQSSTCMALLDRGLNLNQQVGLPVQGLNNLTLQGAAVVPEQNQLRWVSAEGTALVYDFLFDRWSTYTNYDGVGCLLTQDGKFVRAAASGVVWYEDTTSFLDNGIAVPLKISTAWVKPSGQIQGFMAVWEAMLLGTFKSPHLLKVDLFYDYQDFPQFSLTWTPTGAVNVSIYGEESPYGSTPFYGSTVQFAPVYQCRITPPRQVCQAIRFDIYDSGITGESCTLNEIELKLGIMGGLNRTAAKQTV